MGVFRIEEIRDKRQWNRFERGRSYINVNLQCFPYTRCTLSLRFWITYQCCANELIFLFELWPRGRNLSVVNNHHRQIQCQFHRQKRNRKNIPMRLMSNTSFQFFYWIRNPYLYFHPSKFDLFRYLIYINKNIQNKKIKRRTQKWRAVYV